MKTPREILWQQHRSVEPKLDDARRRALASLTPARTVAADVRRRTTRGNEESASLRRRLRFIGSLPGLREMLLSLRWHLAGMTAAWILVALSNIDHSPSPVATVAKERIPSPQQLLAAIRENRRQLLELMELPVLEPAPAPSSGVPQRRGELQTPSAKA